MRSEEVPIVAVTVAGTIPIASGVAGERKAKPKSPLGLERPTHYGSRFQALADGSEDHPVEAQYAVGVIQCKSQAQLSIHLIKRNLPRLWFFGLICLLRAKSQWTKRASENIINGLLPFL